ncbi:GNAT family N-acetyltransferase [Marinobacter sp. 1Y8]
MLDSEPRFQARLLSAYEFSQIGPEWDDLVDRSDADRLFMGWSWLYSWWETWSQVMGLDLLLIGAFDQGGRLVGIGPFYRRAQQMPLGFRVNRVQMLGNAWHVGPSVRSEYANLIVGADRANETSSAIIAFLSKLDWDEVVLCDCSPANVDGMTRAAKAHLGQITQVDRAFDSGIAIDVACGFEEWLAALGKNTRLKVYNRRQRISQRSQIEFIQTGVGSEFSEFLEALSRFHIGRWGSPAFDREAVRFHKTFVQRFTARGGKLEATKMLVDGKCVSVLYDVVIGDRRYNIQSGYDESFDRQIALGTLHLGYAIEQAFADPEILHYDLLAGGGKNTFYKDRLHGTAYSFKTVQLVRKPVLRLIYTQQAKLPAAWRQRINKTIRL